ncbi:MAG: ABC transporter permease [Desulfurococcaceae archaeon]
MSAVAFLAKRLLSMFFVVFSAGVIMFLLLRLAPGDPARLLAGFDAPPEVVEEIRQRYGLDKPFYEQLYNYIVGLIRFDFGISIRSERPVIAEIMSKLPNTVILAVTSLVTSTLMGIALGVLSALKRGSWIDSVALILSSIGSALPVFWTGILLIYLFAVNLRLLPAGGLGEPKHLILPTIAMSLPLSAPIIRTTRAAVVENLYADHVKAALSKGLHQRRVFVAHVLRNSLIPVVTMIGLQLGALIRGAVVTETVFAWPGMGKLLVDAISVRDYPLIQGTVFILALIYNVINFAVDLLYAALDPRIRVEA